ncbi:hypothetical protein [Bacillus cereus]|uniref:hypothetical protein n=1 Tax=Bacillus cereus TaxID=1396 RepID=UPI0018CEF150|nr:hypothetical protein [Bacillus cereus]MBG9611828.1 hypothetical protein [Bacillus cereus]
MNRDLDYEHKLYEIEESPQLNGYILLHLLNELEECSIEQLAISFYLYRFTNVLAKILNSINRDQGLIKNLPEQEIFNLDTVLMPFLTEKYNERFKKGIVQLIARSLINVSNNKISINGNKLDHSKNNLKKDVAIQLKVKLISKLIKEYNVSDLNKIISKMVGERNG